MTYEEELEAQREARASKAKVVFVEPKPVMTRAEVAVAACEQLLASRTTGRQADHLIHATAAFALGHRLAALDAADAAAVEKGLTSPAK